MRAVSGISAYQMSSWTLILLTSERLIAVWLPLKCKELCSRRRIIIAWTVICALLFGANMHFFFTTDIIAPPGVRAHCTVRSQFFHFFVGAWYWIDAFLADFIPFFVVFTGNCVIVAKIVGANRQRTEQMHVADSDVRKVRVAKESTLFRCGGSAGVMSSAIVPVANVVDGTPAFCDRSDEYQTSGGILNRLQPAQCIRDAQISVANCLRFDGICSDRFHFCC